MFPVGEPVPDVTLTPVVGEMLHVELEILDPVKEKLVEPPVAILLPPLLATAKLLGVGHGAIADTVNDAVAFAVVVLQEPVELAI